MVYKNKDLYAEFSSTGDLMLYGQRVNEPLNQSSTRIKAFIKRRDNFEQQHLYYCSIFNHYEQK